MAIKPYLPIEDIRQLIAYDPASGVLTWRARGPQAFKEGERCREWRARNWNSKMAGKPALQWKDKRGVRSGAIFDQNYSAHRVAFALHHGRWPQGEIDHINGDPSDNRAVNLREATRGVNMRNMGISKRNKSGRVGVSMESRTGKWVATISVHGRATPLGRFKDFRDAVAAREAGEEKYGYSKNTRRTAKGSGVQA